MPANRVATAGGDSPRTRPSSADPAVHDISLEQAADRRLSVGDRRDLGLLLALAAAAFVVRAVPVLLGGGLFGLQGYDDGVYFGAATALVHGVIPYRDFLLLHPPGIVVLLSPLAALGSLTGDPVAFAVARASIMLLGALNTVLVGLVAGRHDRLAGLTAAAVYAVWSTASNFERSTDLHAAQNTLLLLALLALSARDRIGPRRAGFAGVALGLATTVQLWQAASVAVVVVWLAWRARATRGDALRPIVAFIAGAVIAIGVVCLPFLAAAPEAMVRYILIDQVSRPIQGVSVIERLRALEGFPQLAQLPTMLRRLVADEVVAVGALAGVALVAMTAWRCPWTRLWAALAVAQTAVVLAMPSFHNDYASFVAPAASLVIGTGIGIGLGRMPQRGAPRSLARGASVLLLVLLAAVSLVRQEGQPLPLADLESDISGARCVTSDAPSLLVLTSAMRRNLDAGCALVLDPSGVLYDADRGRLRRESDGYLRLNAPGFQSAMLAWYTSGDAALFSRSSRGLSQATRAAIEQRLPFEHRHGFITVRLAASP